MKFFDFIYCLGIFELVVLFYIWGNLKTASFIKSSNLGIFQTRFGDKTLEGPDNPGSWNAIGRRRACAVWSWVSKKHPVYDPLGLFLYLFWNILCSLFPSTIFALLFTYRLALGQYFARQNYDISEWYHITESVFCLVVVFWARNFLRFLGIRSSWDKWSQTLRRDKLSAWANKH